MSFPVLEDYLMRLPKAANSGQRIWLGEDDRVRGKYFNYTLTSVFQPVRRLDSDAVIICEAFKRVESEALVDLIASLPAQENPILVQGHARDRPTATIALRAERAPASTRSVPASIQPGPEAA